MEKMKDEKIHTVFELRNTVIDYIENYCIDNNIDIKSIHPSTWDLILQELEINIFIPLKPWFKTKNNINNEYDAEKIYNTFRYVYIYICNKYIQIPNLLSFYSMLHIAKQTIYNINRERLSCFGLDSDKNNLAEVIEDYCLHSIDNLASVAKNPAGLFGVGNRLYHNCYNNNLDRPLAIGFKKIDGIENLPTLAVVDVQNALECTPAADIVETD